MKNSVLCQVGKDGNLFFSSLFVEYRQGSRTNAEMPVAQEGCVMQAAVPLAEENQIRRPRGQGQKRRREAEVSRKGENNER